MKMLTYSFETSQPLTEAQLIWLNDQLINNLPSEELEGFDFEDIPSLISEITLQTEG